MKVIFTIILCLFGTYAHAEWDLKKQFIGKDYTYDGKEPELCKAFVQSVLKEDGQVKIIQPDFEGHSLDLPLFKKNMPTCDTSQFTKEGELQVPMGSPPYQREWVPTGEKTKTEEYFAYYDMKDEGFEMDFLHQGPFYKVETGIYMDRGGVALIKRPDCKRLPQLVGIGGVPMAYENPRTMRSVELVKYKGAYWWVSIVLQPDVAASDILSIESVSFKNVSKDGLLNTKCHATKFYKH